MGRADFNLPWGQLHPYLQFPDGMPHFGIFARRLIRLLNQHPIHPFIVDWEPLTEAGIANDLRQRLMTSFAIDDQQITMQEWVNLFALQDPIYPILCIELLSTARINRHVHLPNDQSFFRFRLGGEERGMSWLNLAAALGIYGAAIHESWFPQFLVEGAIPDQLDAEGHGFDVAAAWANFGDDSQFVASETRYRQIRLPYMRCFQRFISHTITLRKENREKITHNDLWYLHHIFTPGHVNIPYCVAWYLSEAARGTNASSPMGGGHFITRIALFLGIHLGNLDPFPGHVSTLTARHYTAARVLVRTQVGGYLPFVQAQGLMGLPQQQDPPGQPEPEPNPVEQPPHQPGPQEQPPWETLLGMMQGMRVDQEAFQRELRYRSDRQDYSVDWMVHNDERFYQHYPSQDIFVPTYYEPPPMYGPDVTHPAARYDRAYAESVLPHDDEVPEDDDGGDA